MVLPLTDTVPVVDSCIPQSKDGTESARARALSPATEAALFLDVFLAFL